MLTKVVRALAAVGIVLVGPAAAVAEPITLGFSSNVEFVVDSQTYDFGDYRFKLTFLELADDASFDVTVTDILTSQETLEEGQRLAEFSGYVCVPIADGVSVCVEFDVVAPGPGGDTWTGDYEIQIVWFADTNSDFSNEPGNRIRMLHNSGNVDGNLFDTDITLDGTYFGGQPGENDPWIFGRDNNFQSFIVTQAPTAVPEPATLLMLGTGLGSLVLGRRRRRTRS